MSTRTTTFPAEATRRLLHEIKDQLGEAERAVEHASLDEARDAFLGLTRSVGHALADLERLLPASAPRPAELRERLSWWQQQLDDARLQLALAEMDAREARDELVQGLERSFATVSDVISRSVERITVSLTSLRMEIQATRSHSDPAGPHA